MDNQMNIYQKLLKIADMAGVLQKNKAGFNYKYTTEDEIQAKVTAGMKKYGVLLVPNITPNTFHVEPYTYQKTKIDKKTKEVETTTINEILVYGEMQFTWVNVDNPEDKIEVSWAMCGQKDDASQAMGGALTYSNRYFLMKALQMATVEDDPDNYRSKQKTAEEYEETIKLKDKQQEILSLANEKIASGIDKDLIYKVISDNNDGKKNPNSIKNVEICEKVISEIKNLKIKKEGK